MSDVIWNAIIAALLAIILAWIRHLTTIARTTHALVNSNMTTQLKLTAKFARGLATAVPNKENIEAAKLAERLSEEHKA